MQRFRLFIITLAHFCVDSYATILQPVLPLIKKRLELSFAQTGTIGTVIAICNITQPLMGIWADRMSRRYLIIVGLALSAICIPFIGIAPTYESLIFVLALGGIGVAAFHPQVFSLAGELSGKQRSFGLALFIFGGTLGIGLTPFWVPWFIETFTQSRLPYIAIPGIILLLLVLKFVPLKNPQLEDGEKPTFAALKPQAKNLTLICVVVVIRSVTGLAFFTYIPLLAEERGHGLIAGGIFLGIFNVAGVIGSLFFGYLADKKFGSKGIVFLTILGSVPFLYLYTLTENVSYSYVLLAIGGGLLLASNSIFVALAQELAPENTGLASSIPLGLSWGLASLSLPLIGMLGDNIGIEQALRYIALLPIVPAILSLALPRLKKSGE
ncbi:MAG: MFS transporter [Lentisphaeria bacterium]|nr:MFS transporter [Lentisphaeria bacterium]NQZ69527.1 MFS transporter [Lentisphaeria bacterium]